MSHTYAKHITRDFPKGVKLGQLNDEIKNSILSVKFVGVTQKDDINILILFSSLLTPDEVALLSTITQSHIPKVKLKFDNTVKMTSVLTEINISTYHRLDTYVYEGTDQAILVKAVAVASMDDGVTDYQIRIYDRTNRKVIVENTFTNTDLEILELYPINNLPQEAAIFELQTKKRGGDDTVGVNVSSATLYLRNS